MVVPVIPVLGTLRQEAHEFEVSLGYCGNILLAWTTVVLSFCENIAHLARLCCQDNNILWDYLIKPIYLTCCPSVCLDCPSAACL